ncbi:restriction endonuclease subunit S [Microcoleus sp. T3_A4]|uniref:restriction endonuclease subunit S n=1 Tax=Microcoleus sp. T3_A4 TaxID=2818968 RepID=UPI002FD72151
MRETLVKTEEFKDSPLGKIPADWEVLTFEDVSTVRQGLQIAISRRFKDYKPGRYIYITVEYLNNIGNSHLLEFIESPGNRVICHQDDVLVTRTGATGKIITDVEGVFHNNFFLVDYDRSKVNRDYLVCYLNLEQIQKEIKLRAGTTTIPDLKHRDFYSLTFLRPPLAEQEKIALILKSCDETIAHTSSLIAKLKQMKAGLLHDLLTRGLDENGELRDAIGHPEQFKDSLLGRIPKDWEVVKLVDHISLPNGQLDPKQQPYCNWVLIAPDHIESETGRILNLQTAAEQNAISGKYGFQSGDVLYSKIRPYLRKAVLANREGLCSADMYPLRPQPTIVSRFLLELILGEDFSRFATAVSMRSGFPKINREELSEYQLALPTYKEQQRIAEILDTYDTRIRSEEAYRDKLKLQKQGLMHDLLTGKVRVKDADKFTSVGDTV